jgi:hypothetical protein
VPRHCRLHPSPSIAGARVHAPFITDATAPESNHALSLLLLTEDTHAMVMAGSSSAVMTPVRRYAELQSVAVPETPHRSRQPSPLRSVFPSTHDR